jgi:hypothetical protein
MLIAWLRIGVEGLVMRIPNMPEQFSCSSVNKTAKQNVWRHHFLLQGALIRSKGDCGTIWPLVVGIAALQEFYKNYQFLTAHLWHTYGNIPKTFYTFDLKYHRKSEFNKKTSSKKENRGLYIFCNSYVFLEIDL